LHWNCDKKNKTKTRTRKKNEREGYEPKKAEGVGGTLKIKEQSNRRGEISVPSGATKAGKEGNEKEFCKGTRRKKGVQVHRGADSMSTGATKNKKRKRKRSLVGLVESKLKGIKPGRRFRETLGGKNNKKRHKGRLDT